MVGLYLTMLEDPEDQQVFREFYETYHQAMFRATYRVLGSRESAEDAVHDAFLAILEQMPKVKQLGMGRSYAFAVVVTKNKAVDLLRRTRPAVSLDEVGDWLAVAGPEEESCTTVLDELEEPYSTVLTLVGIGFRPREIAKLQRQDVRTVYKQIVRGKKKLLQKLRKDGKHGS